MKNAFTAPFTKRDFFGHLLGVLVLGGLALSPPAASLLFRIGLLRALLWSVLCSTLMAASMWRRDMSDFSDLKTIPGILALLVFVIANGPVNLFSPVVDVVLLATMFYLLFCLCSIVGIVATRIVRGDN